MKKYLLFVFLLLLVPSFVSADITDNIDRGYSFNNSDLSGSNAIDVSGNGNLATNDGADTGQVGVFGESFFFDGVSDDLEMPEGDINTQDFSFSFWGKLTANAETNGFIIQQRKASSPFNGWALYFQSAAAAEGIHFQLSDGTLTDFRFPIAEADFYDSNFHNYIMTVDRSESDGLKLYIDGTLNDSQDPTARSGSITHAVNMSIGQDPGSASHIEGFLDETFLWVGKVLTQNEVNLIQEFGSPFNVTNATPVASERLEQTSTLEQSGSVLINSNSFVTVLSGIVEIETDTVVYATASIPVLNPSKDEDATCRIGLDGVEFNNSETVHNVFTNIDSHMTVFSFGSPLATDNYTFSVECTRQGGLQYTVEGANIIIHKLITVGGVPLVYKFSNASSLTITSGVIHNFSITTSANATPLGFSRDLIIEWGGNFVFSGSGNISGALELAGVNCTRMSRFGNNLDVGIAGSSCVVKNVTNSTVFDIRVFANGSGTLENMVFHTKEVIAHTNEVNFTSLTTGTPLPALLIASPTLVGSANLSIDVSSGHSAPNLVMLAGISVYSNNGTTNASFMLSVQNQNSTIVTIDVFENEPTMVFLQDVALNITGNNTVFIFGACASGNCSVEGVDLVAYLSDAEDIQEIGFDITLQNSYDSSFINIFNVRDDDGNVFGTSSGTLRIFTNDSLFNITHPGNNNTPVKFFENVTLNHNTSGLLALFSRAWTAINAVNIDNFSISNFSISFTDGIIFGNDITSSGIVYVPFENSTFNLSIFDATDSNGIDYANATITDLVIASFLQNFTFNLSFTNSINISFFETFTTDPIFENVTVSFVGPGPSFVNSSNTSNMFVSNLSVGTWTLQASSPLFQSSTYFVTVSDRSTQNLDIFLLNSTLSGETTFTVKDRTTGDIIAGASFDMFQLVNGSFVSIGQQITDAFGVAFYGLVQGDDYQFIVTHPNFDTRIGNFTRTTDSYVVSLTREIGENFDSYLNSFSYFIQPLGGIALSNVSTNFSLTVSSPLGQMEYFSVDFSVNGNISNSTLIDNVTTSPAGGIAIVTLDLGNFTGTLIGTFTMKSVLFVDPLIVGRSWFVTNGTFDSSNFTFTDFMIFYGPQVDPVDDELSLMSRVLLLTIAAVILGLSLSLFFGVDGAILGVSLVYLGGSFYGWLHWSITIVVVTILLGQFFIRGGRI